MGPLCRENRDCDASRRYRYNVEWCVANLSSPLLDLAHLLSRHPLQALIIVPISLLEGLGITSVLGVEVAMVSVA